MIRIGNSIDIHAFCEFRPLILGGIQIEHDRGLLGHSDADVVLHSVSEAIIGALGLGDLGMHFPDTDFKYKGADSGLILAEVVDMMLNNNYIIGNVDITILCEKPHLSKYKDLIKENISLILKTDKSNVNVKATRGEKLGFIGREEGIVSMCSLLLVKKEK